MTRAPTANVGASMMAACPLGDSPKDVRSLGVIIMEFTNIRRYKGIEALSNKSINSFIF